MDSRRQPERLAWSVPELSVLLGIPTATLWRYLAQGVIPSVKIGHARRVPASWVESTVGGAA